MNTSEGRSGAMFAWSGEIRAALRRLDPTQSRVLQLIYFERRSQGEVAEQLDLPVSAVARASAAGMVALGRLIAAQALD